MAEVAIGFAASVASLAAFGIQIVSTLNTFTTSFSRAEQQIKDLSADIALTSSVLESISRTIKEYEDQVGLTVDNFVTARNMCERNFQALWVALRQVKKDETRPKAKGKEVDKKLSVWQKVMHATGGADALKDLVLSIESSKSNLQLLLSSLQFLVLKSLRKSNLLTEEQSEDFRLFMNHLPQLVIGLQQAGLMKAAAGNESPEEKIQAKGANGPIQVKKVDAENESPEEKIQAKSVDGPIHVKKVEVLVNPPGLTENDPPSTEIPVSVPPNDEKHPGVREDPADDAPEAQEKLEAFRVPPQPERELPNVRKSSGESGESQPQSGGYLSGTSSDAQSIYEGWILESEPPVYAELGVTVLCGIRIRHYSIDSSIQYEAALVSNTKEDLKEKATAFNNNSDGYLTEFMADGSSRRTMPRNAQKKIRSLLLDKNRGSRRHYTWKVAAIELQTRKSFWFGRRTRTAKLPLSWLVVFRGIHVASSSMYYDSVSSTETEEESSGRRTRSSRHTRSRSASPVLRVVEDEIVVIEDEDDIVEVIEEHSPSRRPRRKERKYRRSGFRSVDPNAFGGGRATKIKRKNTPPPTQVSIDEGKSILQEEPEEDLPVVEEHIDPEEPTTLEEPAIQEEDAERLMEEYLMTFTSL